MVRRSPLSLIAVMALVASMAAPALAQEATIGPPTATPIASPPAEPSGDGSGVRLTTELGDIVIGVFTESSPVAAENFLNLVNAGFYDGLTFHRLVPGFVIQGGDPAGDGTGGPGYTIEDEPVVGRYGRGIVAMARSQGVNSQVSQFFIVLDDGAERALEAANTYAIFGRVVEGMEVVDEIAGQPNAGQAAGNRALDPVVIISATQEAVTLPPEPSWAPLSGPGASDLEALIPTELGGAPVSVESYNGAELADQFTADNPATTQLEGILGTQGKTIADLSVAFAGAETDTALATITAMRIAGGDAAAIMESMIPFIVGFEDAQLSPLELGGKQVFSITDGPDDPYAQHVYGYANGELLWLVTADEPLLTELFTKLP